MIVLPWPGLRAWPAPTTAASRSPNTTAGSERSPKEMSPASPPPAPMADCPSTGAPPPLLDAVNPKASGTGAESKAAPPGGDKAAGAGSASVAAVENPHVQQITLHQLMTGGYNAGGRPGHEGITAVIEPRGAGGRLVKAAAPVSVVVLDKALSGPAARVARWDFSADQISATWRKTTFGEGFQLQMPWPEAPPAHGQLKLFVRYTTDDGRKLQTSRDVDVQLPGQRAVSWSPAGPKHFPAPTADAAPLWQPKQPASEQAAPPPATAERPVETAARPAVESPPDTAPTEPQSTAQRPVWSPYRR